MTPYRRSPSTIAARNNIGVFAAMITCDHDRSNVFRIASPSRIIDTSDVWLSRWNARALRNARTNVRMRPPDSSSSTNFVRNTRCGTPSTFVVTTVSFTDCDM